MKIRITKHVCPYCNAEVDNNLDDLSEFGNKYERCHRCGKIYLTNKKLYSDLSSKEKKELKTINNILYKILISILIISIILKKFLNNDLFLFLSIISAALIIELFIRDRIDKKKTIDKSHKNDLELQRIEKESSEYLKRNRK